MSPGLYYTIGKKARDLLFKDYAQHKRLQFHYQGFEWSFDFSCQVEEILPGLKTVFRLIIPDSGKAELQYLHDYVGVGAGVGLKSNPTGGVNPIVNCSGVIGSSFVSLGADLGFDISTMTLNKISTGLSFSSAFLIASLTLNDGFDNMKASCYQVLNPLTRTAVAAELKHSFSMNTNTVTVGAQHALFPSTLVKARLNTGGKVGAVVQQELWQKFYISIAGEVDLMDRSNVPKVGFSMAVKP